MGLTLSQRRAVTKAIATRYKRAGRAGKGVILDELCATTGWHRNHPRKAGGGVETEDRAAAQGPRTALWQRCDRRFGVLLGGARRADRQAAGADHERAGAHAAPLRRAAGQRPDRGAAGGDVAGDDGSPLLKSQIPIRTWAQWDDAVPGFVEIDLVGHEGGNALGDHCYTLTVTDIATGWTPEPLGQEQGPPAGNRRA